MKNRNKIPTQHQEKDEEDASRQRELPQQKSSFWLRRSSYKPKDEGGKLPHDVISMHILTRLPLKSILNFKSVSKQWYYTLSSSYFCNTHFTLSSSIHPPTLFVLIETSKTYYLLKYPKVFKGYNSKFVRLEQVFHDSSNKFRLLGSCNGLVCSVYLHDFILWNPITRQFKIFDSDPDNRLINPTTTSRVSWGFGYVSSIDDYKVVRVIELPLALEIKVHVFSFKSNTWKRIDPQSYQHVLSFNSLYTNDAYDYEGNGYLFHTNRGVVCGERINWIVTQQHVPGRRIVSFDLIHETFEAFENVHPGRFICVVRGCLSTYDVNMRGDVSVTLYNGSGGKEEESIRFFRDLFIGVYNNELIDVLGDRKFFVAGRFRIGLVDYSKENRKTYKELFAFDNREKIRLTSYVPSLASPLTVPRIAQ